MLHLDTIFRNWLSFHRLPNNSKVLPHTQFFLEASFFFSRNSHSLQNQDLLYYESCDISSNLFILTTMYIV